MDHRTPSFFSTLTRQKSCSNDEDDDTRRERSSRFSSIVCSLDRKGKERENGKLDGLNSFIRWRVSHTVEEKVVQHEHASICLCSSILAVGNFNLGFRLRWIYHDRCFDRGYCDFWIVFAHQLSISRYYLFMSHVSTRYLSHRSHYLIYRTKLSWIDFEIRINNTTTRLEFFSSKRIVANILRKRSRALLSHWTFSFVIFPFPPRPCKRTRLFAWLIPATRVFPSICG